jgi:hypothetical protein
VLNASAGQLGSQLRADRAQLAQLRGDLLVVARIGDRGDPRRSCAPPRRAGGAGDVDHLDRLVDPDQLDPDGRRERLDVDDHEVDQPDPLGAQLLDLGRHVAPRRMPA